MVCLTEIWDLVAYLNMAEALSYKYLHSRGNRRKHYPLVREFVHVLYCKKNGLVRNVKYSLYITSRSAADIWF